MKFIFLKNIFSDKNKKRLKRDCEAKFAHGVGCVYCGSTPVKRNGKYRFRQQ
jgi:hypothetical protein